MPVTVPTHTAAQVRAAEEPLLRAGVPLMRRAAHGLAEVIAEQHPTRMLVLAGAGDNGGDALFAAAQVAANGTEVDVLRTADRVHDEALAAATDAAATLVELGDVDAAAYDLVVDGILGIGARGGLRGRAREVVSVMMPAAPRVIAVDLPSGLDPDSGEAGEIVLPATTTVTFGAVKVGLSRGHGPALSGRVVLVRLGLELAEAVGVAFVDEIREG